MGINQLNSININIYWFLTRYQLDPIRPNYDRSTISTNHPTLIYPKTTKMTKIPPKPKNCQNTPET